MFDNIMDEELTRKEERAELNCFEKCIGKHTDSLEHGLSVLTIHLAKLSAERKVSH